MNDNLKQKSRKHFLGVEFSTQQVKAVIIDDKLKVLQEVFVHFDSEFPEYGTHGGVNVHEDGLVVTAPVMMWVKAFDMMMDRLRVAGADFSSISAVSGTAQQYSSVYWSKGSGPVLNNLQHNTCLSEQLKSCFSIADCPSWMDSSTTEYCRKLEDMMGGPEKLAEITGSTAVTRSTGIQISKIYQTKPGSYDNTERISLVSSFGCSIFLGAYAPIDYADGSGMNLLDIRTKQWNQSCLDACAPNLRERLGVPVPATTKVGTISKYFVERYDFDPECSVVAFTGDNPSSLAGMCLQKGDIAISMGTSDTLFFWLDEIQPKVKGNLFVNPVDHEVYMAFLGFKNGSLTREKIRDECADGSWDIFNQLLDITPRGNFGNIGMYYHMREMTPDLEGVFRFTKAGDAVDCFANGEIEIRALVEGQCMAMRIHAHKIGLDTNMKRILVTGGASVNLSLLQVLSDVFNSPVYTMEMCNSACLGSAYRAKHAISSCKYEQVIKSPKFSLGCSPNKDAAQVYDPLVKKFGKLQDILKSSTN